MEWLLPISMTHKFWTIASNQRKYLDWAGEQLGIREMDDWYRQSTRSLEQLAGGTHTYLYFSALLIHA
jgi:hypothetical protein